MKATPNRNDHKATFNPILEKIEREEDPSSSSEEVDGGEKLPPALGTEVSVTESEVLEPESEAREASGPEFEAVERETVIEPVEIPKLTRKPRRKSKKIRFDGPGVDEEQLKQILAAAEAARKLQAEKPDKGILLSLALESNEKTVKKAPSMWDYNPDVFPEEFVNMKRKTYLVDPKGKNFCFLPNNVLIRICSMVSSKEPRKD